MPKYKLILTVCAVSFLINYSYAQKNTPDSLTYRATPQKINDLVHTKLDVKFDYAKTYLYGKAWITLKPHFYATDSLTLDAKGMDIKNVSIVNNSVLSPLKYEYDSLQLKINLGKSYKSTDKYTIYIAYTSKPNQFKTKGSAAITDAKGLYFINPDSSVKGKPVQIWTQGETEGSSVWFPTIDMPSQKTTQEISMTVPSKYVTLSNGVLVSQLKNTDGTRTDTWKMDKPHSPYLFMMAVGDFKIYRDKWKNLPVDYYLEPTYAPYAKDIFGKTPAMLEFFSKKLGVDYPWSKYAQIVVRDFVSGAMENTTATLHGDFVQQTKRELLDGSEGERVIAHELFHHWFGDYVTAESWSNLTVNESFADLSETLWAEHSEGKDAGDAHNYDSMLAYLRTPDANLKDLVRFHYHSHEDMFDVVSYQKGGRILNMLRNYLGEDAFYAGLNSYLKTNALSNGEAQQLRLAFEKVSGKDLNWFFNQWYYNAGHPDLNITYKWNEQTKTQTVYLAQTQKQDAFILPIKIDVYANGKKETHNYWMNSKTDSVSFNISTKPSLVNVDADKILLANKTDIKTIEEYAFQYKNAPLYLDRLEAIDGAIKNIKDPKAKEIILAALKDPYFELRIKALDQLNLVETENRINIPAVLNIAKTDPKTLVRAAAIDALSALKDSTYLPLFNDAIKSQSYAIQGAALGAIAAIDLPKANQIAKTLEKDSKGALTNIIANIYSIDGSDAQFNYVLTSFENASVQNKFQLIPAFSGMLINLKETKNIEKGLIQLFDFSKKYKAYGVDKYTLNMLQNVLASKEEELKKATNSAHKALLDSQIKMVQKTIDDLSTL